MLTLGLSSLCLGGAAMVLSYLMFTERRATCQAVTRLYRLTSQEGMTHRSSRFAG